MSLLNNMADHAQTVFRWQLANRIAMETILTMSPEETRGLADELADRPSLYLDGELRDWLAATIYEQLEDY